MGNPVSLAATQSSDDSSINILTTPPSFNAISVTGGGNTWNINNGESGGWNVKAGDTIDVVVESNISLNRLQCTCSVNGDNIQDIVEEVVSGSNEQTRKCIVTIPSGEASEIQLDLEIEDIIGNTNTTTVSTPIVIDNTAPYINQINIETTRVTPVDSADSPLKEDDIIIVEFQTSEGLNIDPPGEPTCKILSEENIIAELLPGTCEAISRSDADVLLCENPEIDLSTATACNSIVSDSLEEPQQLCDYIPSNTWTCSHTIGYNDPDGDVYIQIDGEDYASNKLNYSSRGTCTGSDNCIEEYPTIPPSGVDPICPEGCSREETRSETNVTPSTLPTVERSQPRVIDETVKKMVSRHPHVFQDKKIQTVSEVNKQWEEIKRSEKSIPRRGRMKKELNDISVKIPALTKSMQIQKKAANVGFDWNASFEIINKIYEEIDEFINEDDNNNASGKLNELGDILFSVVNLARFVGIDPETALRSTNQKFVKRLIAMEKILNLEGKEIVHVNKKELNSIWQKIKYRQ